MCVIVLLPKRKSLPKNIWKNCYDHNSDGWGIMYAENGKLVIKKSMGKFDEFYSELLKCPHNVDIAVHFRFATHGLKNVDNAHPYTVIEQDGEPTVAMMHNGVISVARDINADMSDTWHFVEKDIKPLIAGDVTSLFDDHENFDIISGASVGSKLLFMDNQGNFKVTSPANWHKEQGAMFSNSYSLCPVSYMWRGGGYDYYDGHGSGGFDDLGGYGSTRFVQSEKKGLSVTQNGRSAAAPLLLPAIKPQQQEVLAPEDEYEISANDLYDMSETEIFNFCCDNPEKVTDILLELMGR